MRNVLIVSDIHFGWSDAYGRIDPETGLHTRLEDYIRSFNSVIDYVFENDIGTLVIGGDLFKSRQPTNIQQTEFAKCLLRIVDHNAKVSDDKKVSIVIITGNHDVQVSERAHVASIYKELNFPFVHIHSDLSLIEIEGVYHICLPYVYRQRMNMNTNEELMKWYEEQLNSLKEQIPEGSPSIAIAHQLIEGVRLSSGYSSLNQVDEIVVPKKWFEGIDAVFAGHVHNKQGLKKKDPLIMVVGAMERKDFGDEGIEKGFVDYNPQTKQAQFVNLTTREFQRIKMNFSEQEVDVTDEIKRIVDRNEVKDKIARLEVEVKSEQLPLRENELREYFKEAFFFDKIGTKIIRSEQKKDSNINETLSPLKNLDEYLKTRDDLQQDFKDEMNKTAKEIIDEEEEKAQQGSIIEPVHLRLVNFLSHTDSELYFDKLGAVTLIVGKKDGDERQSNGAGKTTIFDGLTWCLYNKSRASGTKHATTQNLVREGAEEAKVEFTFKCNEILYKIERSYNCQTDKSSIVFKEKKKQRWRTISKDRKTATNKKIAEYIGMDYEVFENSVFCKQHEISSLASKTSGERREIVKKILALDIYDVYSKKAKDKVNQYEVEIQDEVLFIDENVNAEEEKKDFEDRKKVLQNSIDVSEKNIKVTQKALDDLREKQAKWNESISKEKEYKNKIQQLSRDNKELVNDIKIYQQKSEEQKEKLKKYQQQYKEKKEHLFKLESEKIDKDGLAIDLKKIRAVVKESEEEQQKIQSQLDIVKDQIKEKKREIESIQELGIGKCSNCFQQITVESKERTVEEFKKTIEEKSKKENDIKNKLKIAIEKTKEDKKKEEELDKKKEQYNNKILEKKNLVESMQSIKELGLAAHEATENASKLIKQYTERLQKQKKELNKTEEQLQKIGDVDHDKYRVLQKQVEDKNQKIETLSQQVNSFNQQVGILIANIETKDKIIQQIQQKKKKIEENKKKRELYNELSFAFGKQGIQALVLQNSTYEIQEVANSFLEKLTDGVSLQISTQRTNKTDENKTQEVFDIIITDPYHTSPFENFSGGERFRIAFAIRIALSILLARRSGAQIRTMWYDEAFSDLDQDGIDKLSEIFGVLTKYFKYQLIITHQTELKALFDDILCVSRDKSGSKIIQ